MTTISLIKKLGSIIIVKTNCRDYKLLKCSPYVIKLDLCYMVLKNI